MGCQAKFGMLPVYVLGLFVYIWGGDGFVMYGCTLARVAFFFG